MGRQDVRQALAAMDADEAVRERLAAGDFAAIDGLDLSTDEQTLVRDAASDMPEVAGFAADIFAKISDIKGESLTDTQKGWTQQLAGTGSSLKWHSAVNYAWKF